MAYASRSTLSVYPGIRPQRPGPRNLPQNLPIEYPAMHWYRPARLPPTIFRHQIQSGLVPLLYAEDDNPLELWAKQLRLGTIHRMSDPEFADGHTVEIMAANHANATTFITSPISPFQTLGIHLPILIMHMKNMGRQFQFTISVKDDVGAQRRILFSTEKETKRFGVFNASVELRLREGWNEIRMDLGYFLRRLFGRNFREVNRIQIHACCRLRMVCFTDQPEIATVRASPPPMYIHGRSYPRGCHLTARPSHYGFRNPEVDLDVLAAIDESTRRIFNVPSWMERGPDREEARDRH